MGQAFQAAESEGPHTVLVIVGLSQVRDCQVLARPPKVLFLALTPSPYETNRNTIQMTSNIFRSRQARTPFSSSQHVLLSSRIVQYQRMSLTLFIEPGDYGMSWLDPPPQIQTSLPDPHHSCCPKISCLCLHLIFLVCDLSNVRLV